MSVWSDPACAAATPEAERAMAWVEKHGGGFRVRAREAGRVYTDSVHTAHATAAVRAEEVTGQERAPGQDGRAGEPCSDGIGALTAGA